MKSRLARNIIFGFSLEQTAAVVNTPRRTRGFILPPAHYFRRLSQTRRMTKYDFLRRLDNFADMKERTLDVGGTEVAVYFLDPMCSSDKITRFVTEPLLSLGRKATVKNCLEKIIYGADCVATSDADTLVEEFLEEQTRQKREDNFLVEKVQNLEERVKALTEDENVKYSVEELAVFLDMEPEEMEAILRLTGDDSGK